MKENTIALASKENLSQGIKAAATQLRVILGNDDKIRELQRNLYQLVMNPTIEECTRESVVKCGLEAIDLDLSLSETRRLTYVIPYRDNKKNITEAQLRISYLGWQTLLERADKVVETVPIYTGDVCDLNNLTNVYSYIKSSTPIQDGVPKWVMDNLQKIIVKITDKETGKLIKMQEVSRSKLDQLKSYSKTDKFWSKWPLEMFNKTAMTYVMRKMPMPEKISKALAIDMGVTHEAEEDKEEPTEPMLASTEPTVTMPMPIKTPVVEPISRKVGTQSHTNANANANANANKIIEPPPLSATPFDDFPPMEKEA